MALEEYETYEAVKARLDEIVEAVGAEGISLDDALALYEEAVNLGLHASNLLEEGEEEDAAKGGPALQEASAEVSSASSVSVQPNHVVAEACAPTAGKDAVKEGQ